MARKNGLKNDSNSTLTFNSRTKAVMADVVQDHNIKEKVTAVREVVSGRSNNEIIMVLQFYDYDVARTIQAYVEDGAKEALMEWQFSGSKPVKKKRNKKKSGNSAGGNTSATASLNDSSIPDSPESVSSEAGSATGFMVNGDAGKPVLNGVLERKLLGIDENQNAISNGPTTRGTYPGPYPTHIDTQSPTSPPLQANGHSDANNSPDPSITTGKSANGTSPEAGRINKNKRQNKTQNNSNSNTVSKNVSNSSSVVPKSKPAVENSKSGVHAVSTDMVTLTLDNDVTLPGAVEVKVNQGAKEKSPPQALPQRQQHSAHNNRHRNHSGSHGHHEGKHGQHGKHSHHDEKHNVDRERTTSTSSTDGNKFANKKHSHMERSSKDLHRQTVSLERLRLVFNEEIDRSYKRIKTVFDEIRNCLNHREEQLISEVKTVKDTGRDTFIMRQGLAADLKVKIDRAERMSDAELADLRSEIKHFVSDRKIDDDLARTTRFLYDDDKIKNELKLFGEVVPLKCGYMQRRNSSTSVSSSIATSEPDHPAMSSNSIKTSVQLPTPVVSGDPEKVSGSTHLDAGQAHEMAELQRRLKHSLTLEGIPVETFPDHPSSSTTSGPSSVPKSPNMQQDTPRPDGSRRNNRNRRRNDRDRPSQSDRPRDDARSSFSQTPNGERVILIGRKTGPQGGGSRPPRGGRGRGAGGGYRGDRAGGRGRNDSGNKRPGTGGNSDNVTDSGGGAGVSSAAPSENKSSQGQARGQGQNAKVQRSPATSGRQRTTSGGQGQSSSPRKEAGPLPQREKSGSPRRGGGRGRGAGRGPSGGNLGGNTSQGQERSPNSGGGGTKGGQVTEG